MRILLIKKILILICLLPTLIFSQETDRRGVTVQINKNQTTAPFYKGSYALIIGNADYKNWNQLSGVKNDVPEVKQALEANGFIVETANDLNKYEFRSRIERFIRNYGYEEQNRLIIYYAGHGVTSEKTKESYLVPIDMASANDLKGDYTEGISSREIVSWARIIRAKHVLFVFDACFSTSSTSSSRGAVVDVSNDSNKIEIFNSIFSDINDDIPPFIQSMIMQPVRQFIIAAQSNQNVPDDSIFRRLFVRGITGEADLNSDGFVLGSELALYLRDTVANYSHGSQIPSYGKILDVELDRGDFVFTLPEAKKRLQILEQSLAKSQSKNDTKSEVALTTGLSKIYDQLGNEQKALYLYSQTLNLARQYDFLPEQANSLSNLMFYWNARGSLNLAVSFGKESVNIFQKSRAIFFKDEIERNFLEVSLRHADETYRKLAEILVAEGRLFEAQQVLAMLKENEYFSYVRRDADEIKKLSARADLRSEEQTALVKYEQFAGKVTEYGNQFEKLEELKNTQGADFKQQSECDDLKAKLDAANAAFRIFLDKELAAELGKSVKKEIEIDRALQTKLQQWGKGTVALYTVAGDDRYRVILTTPKAQVDGKTEIKIADLNKKIFEFRAALQNPAVDPRPLGKELYDILIKPVERDLQAAEAKTLLWSLDGTLRYIPFAALSPDGVHYLAEKYQNVVITSTTRQSLLAEADPHWRLLGAGVTKASKLTEPNGTQEITFGALPEVRNELLKIVSSEDAKPKENGLLAGIRLLDEGFDLTTLENGMTQRTGGKPKYNVIHLATHFRLGIDTAKSFLLMGNNQALTLEKVSDDTGLNFGDVELVTLSACNTGFGTALENKAINKEQERKQLEANNGAEVDSLATFIELRGAKAVLASLWSVADESTQMLMSEFYRLRTENPQMTKAEAMQQAQKSMIAGKLKSSGKQTGCRSEIIILDGTQQTAYKCDTNAPFAHPYFWSPFVLIGNWR